MSNTCIEHDKKPQEIAWVASARLLRDLALEYVF
jgi:hypothetical protein